MPVFAAKPVNKARANTITDLVADVVADCMLPVSIEDSTAFTALINFLEPNYALSCRQTMTIRLREKQTHRLDVFLSCVSEKQTHLKENIKADIASDKNTMVSITTDI